MKGSKPKPKRISKEAKPSDDFVSVARRLGADEDKGRFEAMLGKIAKATKDKSDPGWVKTGIKIGVGGKSRAKTAKAKAR
jgi:hypothetical protein